MPVSNGSKPYKETLAYVSGVNRLNGLMFNRGLIEEGQQYASNIFSFCHEANKIFNDVSLENLPFVFDSSREETGVKLPPNVIPLGVNKVQYSLIGRICNIVSAFFDKNKVIRFKRRENRKNIPDDFKWAG